MPSVGARRPYRPIGIARLDVEKNEFTGFHAFPKNGDGLKPYTDPATTLFLPFTLKGKIVPFDFKEKRWCKFLDVPQYGKLFGFMGGPIPHKGRLYFSLSTYNGTDTGCDGKPYHFCNAILEFDPQTRRFEFPTLEAKDAYHQVAYMLSAKGEFIATGSNIREKDGKLNRDRAGEVVFWQTMKPTSARTGNMPWVIVAKDKKTFVLESGKPFTPWGFNYDHDADGRLIEDYWDEKWQTVEAHFGQMKKLGAKVVRIHLQVGKFMEGPDKANEKALARLDKLLRLAEKERLYLDLTGLGCYHKKDVPDWYDKLAEKDRWDVQARFWRAVAGRCAESPAVFCYDLMNEPVVPGGKGKDWLGPPFGGKHFVQFITLDQQDRPRPDIARQWVRYLTAAIRENDKRHLITVGLVDWSLDRPGLTSGFVPAKIADDLDFISVHIYPAKGNVKDALETLAGYSVGKPVVIEETFPLKCSPEELGDFIEGSKKHAAGWIGFYWGKTPQELRRSNTIADAITLGWLELFERKAKALNAQEWPK